MQMNTFEELLKQCKSIRNFSQRQIDEKIINKLHDILSMGARAGGINSVRSKMIYEKAERDVCFIACGMQEVSQNAPYLLVIGNDNQELGKKYSDEWIVPFGIENSSLVAQNAILYLTEQKISSCWVGGFSSNYLEQKLNLAFTPWVLLCFGYINEISND